MRLDVDSSSKIVRLDLDSGSETWVLTWTPAQRLWDLTWTLAQRPVSISGSQLTPVEQLVQQSCSGRDPGHFNVSLPIPVHYIDDSSSQGWEVLFLSGKSPNWHRYNQRKETLVCRSEEYQERFNQIGMTFWHRHSCSLQD